MHGRLCMVICTLVVTIWLVRPAHANSVVFTPVTNTQRGVQGGVVAFHGTLMNTGTANVFLNGVVSFISSSDLPVDNEPFFVNAPLFLPPGGSFTGHLFNVAIEPQAAVGTLPGSFTIQGGTDADAFDTLASATFSVSVSVPTPFTAFTTKLELTMGPSPSRDSFELDGTVTLGSGSNGIAPLTENVSLVLEGGRGAFTTTIPAGSFRARRDGRLTFEGRIDGVALEIRISPVSSTQFRFQAEGTAAYLSGIANPVVVTLTLGDDSGTTSVTAQMQ